MCNKVFSFNFDMANPNTSLFLSNVQWKLVKQVIYRLFFHIATVTVNMLEIVEIFPGMYLACAIKCFPSILVLAIQIHQHFSQCSVEGCQTI